MLKNYTLVAFRNITRNRLFSSINIIGLAISMAVGLLAIRKVLGATVESLMVLLSRSFMILALLVICTQTFRAAINNSSENRRNE